MNAKQLKRAAAHMRDRGIEFLIPSKYGLTFSDVDAVVEYCADPDGRLAQEHGVGLSVYLAWKAWRDSGGRCRFDGCEDPVEASVVATAPADFQQGRTDRCRRHQTTEPPA